nr:immunoglobulin heavy chain junction region [Mus musculus]MBK4196433.1 immunoglobulin heavy chain junction region [Mus musculus]MBK4196434.1 immunoglobulin heavy chain junction region [Mus musculus]MBK4196435.1 immunoglobulin heavy chain junction region [Mus musculus]
CARYGWLLNGYFDYW